jgi:hypothetical protein
MKTAELIDYATVELRYPLEQMDNPVDLIDRLLGALTEAVEAATKRTVTLATAAELEALPDRAAVIDKFGDVLHYRGGLWCSYEAQPMGSEWVARKCGPVTVFYTPEAR